MDGDHYRFSVDDLECISVLDGYVDYPVELMYANVPREQIEKALREHALPTDKVTTPYTYLIVDYGGHRILVDTGAGGLHSGTGKIIESMRSAGVEPETIDTIIITHAHRDHIGGLLNKDGQLNFPEARYFIQKIEWDFWLNDPPDPSVLPQFYTFARSHLPPIADRVEQVNAPCEIFSGVRMVPAAGHTPGHALAAFKSGNMQLWYTSDTVLQPLHLEHPEWLPVFDVLPEQARMSKQQVFDQAAAEHVLVLGQHFPPFPSLGYISKKPVGWRWMPLTDISSDSS